MLTRTEALSWFVTNEPWEAHCKNVARVSELIAQNIDGIDSEYAYVYGLIHDIGRMNDRVKKMPEWHPVEGFNFVQKKGYPKEAMSCITHSFPTLEDITLVPGLCYPDWGTKTGDKAEIFCFISEKLDGYKPTIYDKIVLLSDLMSGGDKTILIKDRLERVYSKFGDKPNKDRVYEEIFNRKHEIECLTKKSLEAIVGL